MAGRDVVEREQPDLGLAGEVAASRRWSGWSPGRARSSSAKLASWTSRSAPCAAWTTRGRRGHVAGDDHAPAPWTARSDGPVGAVAVDGLTALHAAELGCGARRNAKPRRDRTRPGAWPQRAHTRGGGHRGRPRTGAMSVIVPRSVSPGSSSARLEPVRKPPDEWQEKGRTGARRPGGPVDRSAARRGRAARTS